MSFDASFSFEVTENKGSAKETLQEIEAVIDDIFPKTIEVLKTHETRTARYVMQLEQATAKKSEKIVTAMIRGEDKSLPIGDAVCIALYVRHLKRINAHLTNIASSIVNPFPRIGFREKKKTNGD